MRLRACLLVTMTLGLAAAAPGTAGTPAPPPAVPVEKLLANPADYEGKPVVVRVTVSGAVFEGPRWLRLAVNGRPADKVLPDGVHFVVPKASREAVLKGLSADATPTADLTVTLERGKGKDKHWFAVVSELAVQSPVVEATPAAGVAKPVVQAAVAPDSMSLRQLLEAYDPSEADNAVGQRLAKVTKGLPAIVFDKSGAVNTEASEALVKEIKEGFPPRPTYSVQGVPHKAYKVGESPNKLYAENPLYPASALRSDGTCDRTERSWDGVPVAVRQVLYLAVTKTAELKVEKPDDAHTVLDKLAGPAAAAEAWAKSRYPKASILYDDLKARGELPSLKLSSVQRPPAEAPKPTAAPSPPAPAQPAPATLPPTAAP